jgi:hypothetical protein
MDADRLHLSCGAVQVQWVVDGKQPSSSGIITGKVRVTGPCFTIMIPLYSSKLLGEVGLSLLDAANKSAAAPSGIAYY